MLLEELKVAEAEKAEKERKVKDEDNVMTNDDKEKNNKEKERESNGKQGKHNDSRDWKRNGLLTLFRALRQKSGHLSVLDERWLDWLDSKIALLINRDGVDPRVYGGKSYDE